MKKYIILISIISLHFTINAQEVSPKLKKLKSIYLEILGKTVYGSFNYEHTLKNYKNGYLTGSIGLSLLPTRRIFNLAIPLNVKYVFGVKTHHLELGLGATFHVMNLETIYVKTENGNLVDKKYTDYYNWLYLTPSIGYRYQKPTNGIFFTINFIPIFGIFVNENSSYGSTYRNNNTEWFKDAAFFPFPVMPWVGFSIGYSFR